MAELRTERLLLRQWEDRDLDPWAAMNAREEVRRYLGPVLTRDQAAASVARFRAALDERGWGWWAVEVRETGRFIGFTGMDPVDDDVPHLAGGVEIGWRLAPDAWGHGYATEGARAVVGFAFETLGLPEVLAITAEGNTASQAVMRRLGMTEDPGAAFADESAPPDSPYRRQVVYRLERAAS
ncbi:GNAT family N-acetyltransferase [Streptacidiphilus monticola]|uniref:GNAT family N-acetyltransferase n=1 Tax=Streptacidiphilus monticola TaxID=2161674 RepID=A0ABW1FY21_9ACTN